MTENVQTEFTAADAVVQELLRAGVEVVFGIISIHNLPIYQAIRREGSIRLITARGESGAVNMADGYARATGKLGVVITSTGSGAGNAAGSLVEAWSAGVPLLHITGEIESPYIQVQRHYIHECKDQLGMMDAASKKAYRLRKPEQAAGLTRWSIKQAFAAPTGPITLELPIDFQTAIVPKTDIVEESSIPNEHSKGINEGALPKRIIEQIWKSKRPVIWAGGGVIKSGAAGEVKQLAELLDAPDRKSVV